MSGHDIAAKPHKTTHQLIWDQGVATSHDWMPGGQEPARETLQMTPARPMAGSSKNAEGSPGSPPLGRIAVMWTYWRNVKSREVPVKEKRSGPRSSRFADLEG